MRETVVICDYCPPMVVDVAEARSMPAIVDAIAAAAKASGLPASRVVADVYVESPEVSDPGHFVPLCGGQKHLLDVASACAVMHRPVRLRAMLATVRPRSAAAGSLRRSRTVAGAKSHRPPLTL